MTDSRLVVVIAVPLLRVVLVLVLVFVLVLVLSFSSSFSAQYSLTHVFCPIPFIFTIFLGQNTKPV